MSEEYTSEQAEAMYNEAMAPSSDTGDIQQPSPEEAPQVQEPTAEELFDLKWGGETKQFPKDKVISYAQQGYDYSQNMQKFNLEKRTLEQERSAWQAERDAMQAKYDNLGKIDEYARQNPQWLNLIQSEYQKVQGGGESLLGEGAQANEIPFVNELKSEVLTIKEQLAERAKIEEQQRMAQEDAALDNEIMQYKEKYGSFDWNSADQITGLNLEQQILQHSQDRGINNFRAAANDFLHDKLIAQAEERAKEGLAQGIRKDTQLGLGAPTRSTSLLARPAVNIASKSWEELVAEGLNDLNI